MSSIFSAKYALQQKVLTERMCVLCLCRAWCDDVGRGELPERRFLYNGQDILYSYQHIDEVNSANKEDFRSCPVQQMALRTN